MSRFTKRTALVPFSLMVAVSACGAPLEGDEVGASVSEIVGGSAASATGHPWMVQLRINGATFPNEQFCGGTLLTSRFVLTAAHCVDGLPASSLQVVAGLHDRRSLTAAQVRSVRAFAVHPSFVRATLVNDLALVELSSPVTASSTVGFATTASLPIAGTNLNVFGWGNTSEGGSTAAVLQTARVPLWSTAACTSAYRGVTLSTMFCAGPTAGGIDACQSDSGGPVVDASNRLVGVVSWGVGCARPGQPGVYASVSSGSPWFTTYFTAPTSTTVTRVRVSLVTGNDDLRCGGQAFLSFRRASGAFTAETALTDGAGLPSNTRRVTTVAVPAEAQRDVVGVRVRHQSGACNEPFATHDNWDLGVMLYSAAGPIVRFTGDRSVADFALTP
jgi:trypsin